MPLFHSLYASFLYFVCLFSIVYMPLFHSFCPRCTSFDDSFMSLFSIWLPWDWWLTLEVLPLRGGGSARRPKRTRGEREERVGDQKTDSTQIDLNKTSSGNRRSTSNHSCKHSTVLQYPPRNPRCIRVQDVPGLVTLVKKKKDCSWVKSERQCHGWRRSDVTELRVCMPLFHSLNASFL